MMPIMTIPRVSSRWLDTLERVCPPIMQFRMRKPCIENTFRALGIIEPKYLFLINIERTSSGGNSYPQE